MCLAYLLSAISFVALLYVIFLNYQQLDEGFYPRQWWGPDWKWSWKRNYLDDIGNWRPYGFYPAYSGYWRQCPSGSWCPPNISCRDSACQ